MDTSETPHAPTAVDMAHGTAQKYDKNAILRRLATHRSEGGALITTADFNVQGESHDKRSIKIRFPGILSRFPIPWEPFSRAEIKDHASCELIMVRAIIVMCYVSCSNIQSDL